MIGKLYRYFFPVPFRPYLGKRSPRWPKVRRDFLALYPTCACCGTDANLNVHHKKPFHLYPGLELDFGNLVTLCEGRCHFLVGHLCDWRSYNPDVEADAAAFLDKIHNRPEPGLK